MIDLKNRHGSYSIAIRTTGKAGERYQKLLNSIQALRMKPEKVVIILPNGYSRPNEILGYEEIYFCRKSMIQQRIEALKYIDSDYTLFLDDDIEFRPEFVENLLSALDSGLYSCATGPLFSFFPKSLAGKIAGSIMGSVVFRIYNRGYYVKILSTGGWSYRFVNTHKQIYYPTESFAWTCFMIRTDVMRAIRMEDETIWLERTGYAWGDDRVMAYKLVLLGYKACIVANALYCHNDARTSVKELQLEPLYAASFNHYVFWHRFLFSQEHKTARRKWMVFCINYYQAMNRIYNTIRWLQKRLSIEEYNAIKKGFDDAKKYTNTDEYLGIKKI